MKFNKKGLLYLLYFWIALFVFGFSIYFICVSEFGIPIIGILLFIYLSYTAYKIGTEANEET